MKRLIGAMEIGDKAFARLVLITFFAILLHRPILQVFDDLTTPQPWFAASFAIPDHRLYDDPIVTYTRTINRPVRGLWSVSLHVKGSDGANRYVCSGSGYAAYFPETTGEITMPLTQFTGARCHGPPGDYRACATYDLEDIREARRVFGPFCTSFIIRPK